MRFWEERRCRCFTMVPRRRICTFSSLWTKPSPWLCRTTTTSRRFSKRDRCSVKILRRSSRRSRHTGASTFFVVPKSVYTAFTTRSALHFFFPISLFPFPLSFPIFSVTKCCPHHTSHPLLLLLLHFFRFFLFASSFVSAISFFFFYIIVLSSLQLPRSHQPSPLLS